MEEEKEVEISEDKVYNLPPFQIVKYKDQYLAIATELAIWVVLTNENQLTIFKMLQKGTTVGKILNEYETDQEDIAYVLTQIEAKKIESAITKSAFSNTKLHLHVTNQCNMRCPHCYMKSGNAYNDELSTDEIKSLCDQFYHAGGTDVFLTGGEPTVRPDFFELVEYISRLGMKVSIYSNGLFWNEERVRRLASQNVDCIQISIDGYDEESNSLVRGKNAFERALNAVALFVKYRIFVKIAVTPPYEVICAHSAEYIRFSRKLLEKYGKEAIQIDYSYFLMPGRNLSAEVVAERKTEYYALVDQVVTGIYGDTAEDSFVSNVSEGICDSCGYGGLNVMANGDFYFCDRIPDVAKIGNIRDMPFEEIHALMQAAQQAGKIDNFKPCNTCALKYICGGGCRAEHFRQFTKLHDISNINFDHIEPRTCSQENKEKFYELMLKTNERFFC
ncbi:radical SAM/SPASM domain-containing protein [Subdoligranulum variabile]|uniref:Radical SAM domain protein n=1 Tax=Subdoligranulum variabile DSM 15176 TaxID=411471 RepID=D1PS04_9FIRM|nr:radical SAM protein [Subdoligranulum variabile]EFB74532.1 radical SAM domain protein [Subdoligranulum variabile DSM 15176]UWP69560.1 radical SAM protein [Subdoligranulum variabile]